MFVSSLHFVFVVWNKAGAGGIVTLLFGTHYCLESITQKLLYTETRFSPALGKCLCSLFFIGNCTFQTIFNTELIKYEPYHLISLDRAY